MGFVLIEVLAQELDSSVEVGEAYGECIGEAYGEASLATRRGERDESTGEAVGVRSGVRVGARLRCGARGDWQSCESEEPGLVLRSERSECESGPARSARYGRRLPMAELVLRSERLDARLQSELALTLEASSSL